MNLAFASTFSDTRSVFGNVRILLDATEAPPRVVAAGGASHTEIMPVGAVADRPFILQVATLRPAQILKKQDVWQRPKVRNWGKQIVLT